MQVSVESTGTIGRRMTVTVPVEKVEEAVMTRLRRMSKQVKMAGFRPGKVPLKMVEAQYGGQIMQEVSGELIQSSFREALGEQGLQPAAGPKIEPKSLSRGQDLEYIAEFDVFPEITGLDLSGKTLERPVCEVEDADIDRTLENMRQQRKTWQEVDREAALNDQVVIDFKGFVEGEAFDGGEARDAPLELGSGRMIAGFEDGIVGIKAGEDTEIEVTFPREYQTQHLAGKAAKFEIKVKSVSEPVLPEIDEDFAKDFGVDSGDVARLREDVKTSLEREKAVRLRNIMRSRVLNALLEENTFDLPQGMVSSEIAKLKQTEAAQRQQQGLPPGKPSDDSVYEPAARRRVALGLIVAEIIKQRDIKADAKRVRSRIDEMASGYDKPGEVVSWYFEKPERLHEIESLVMEEQLVVEIETTATIKDKSISFEELLNISNEG